MGRSVLIHPNAELVAYMSWQEGYTSYCRYCDEEVKHDGAGWELVGPSDHPQYCAARYHELITANHGYFTGLEDAARHEGWEYDRDDWQNDAEATIYLLKDMWASLYETDRWLYNEVHVVLQNDLVEVTLSEYCGLTALCVAPRGDLEGGQEGLAKHWLSQIAQRFDSTFGEYAKLGTFSNGEAVYERKVVQK